MSTDWVTWPLNVAFTPTTGLDASTCPPLPNLLTEQNTTGDDVTVQTFYEGPPTCKCCKNWVEKEPAEVPEEAKKKYTGAAIIVYKSKDHDSETLGGLKKFKASMLTIQSPIICKEIAPILLKQRCAFGEDATITMENPFKELYFSRSAILSLYDEKENGSEEKQHLGLLSEVMHGLFRELEQEVVKMHAKRLISNSLLWTLFPCGMIVYSQTDDHKDQALEAIVFSNMDNVLPDQGSLVVCQYVEFTGTSFGVGVKNISIPHFEGTRSIDELKVYPLKFHPDAPTIRGKLFQRGRKALDYQDISCGSIHRESVVTDCWDGSDGLMTEGMFSDVDITLPVSPKRKSRRATSQISRVVIDSFIFYREGPGRYKTFTSLIPSNFTTGNDPEEDEAWKKSQELLKLRRRPSTDDQNTNRELVESKSIWAMLIAPTLPAFILREKRWGFVEINDMRPVDWARGAYDQLLIPPDRKDWVLTFAQNHRDTRGFGTDIIQGKGQGLVVLLSGPPGTGKTLTVEAVSERIERPLYHLQAGELGLNPISVKSELKKAFEYCEEWDCILLLDEADTLIRSRGGGRSTTEEDLCCILLATLEYYSGIIFLTTNLPDNIDAAISSRIDIHLQYSNLDFDTRLQLWKNFVINPPKARKQDNERPPVAVSEADFKRLARWRLNGRDIKHAVNNATKWCFIKKIHVTVNALEVGIQVTAPSAVMEDLDDTDQNLDNIQPPTQKRKRV